MSVILFLTTFLFFPLTLASFFTKAGHDNRLGLVASVGLSPLIHGWFVGWLMFIAEGKSELFYAVCVTTSVAILFGLRIKVIVSETAPELLKSLRSFLKSLREPLPFLATALCLALLSLAFFEPISGNDPLDYATAAGIIYETTSSAVYPFAEAYPNKGYFRPWTHPLGYIGVLTWTHLISGNADFGFLQKLIAPLYLLLLCLIPFSKRSDSNFQALYALMLLSSVYLLRLALVFHVDPIRLFSLSLFGAVCLKFVLQKVTLSSSFLVLGGLSCGMAVYTHSLGVAAPLCFGLSLLILATNRRVEAFKFLVFSGLLSILVFGLDLYKNYTLLGIIIGDAGTIPVWSIDKYRGAFETYRAASRGLDTFNDKLMNGFLMGFTAKNLFGISYFLMALGVLLLPFGRKDKNEMQPVAVFAGLSLLAFYLVVFVGDIVLGNNAFIKNVRYLLTLQVSVALLGAYGITQLSRVLARLESKRFVSILLQVALLIVATYLIYENLEIGYRYHRSSVVYSIHFAILALPFLLIGLFKRKGFINVLVALALVLFAQTYAVNRFAITTKTIFANLPSDFERLKIVDNDAYTLISFLRENISKKAKFFTLRQSELGYYTDYQYAFHLDPAQIEIFGLTSIERTKAYLDRNGFTHLLLANETEPHFSSSPLFDLTGDPEYSDLLFSNGRFRVLRLRKVSEDGWIGDNSMLTKEAIEPAKDIKLPLTSHSGQFRLLVNGEILDGYLRFFIFEKEEKKVLRRTVIWSTSNTGRFNLSQLIKREHKGTDLYLKVISDGTLQISIDEIGVSEVLEKIIPAL